MNALGLGNFKGVDGNLEIKRRFSLVQKFFFPMINIEKKMTFFSFYSVVSFRLKIFFYLTLLLKTRNNMILNHYLINTIL